ncbi:MAG: lysophospholipid acyltransferase family protein [Terriglobia bacterium]
MSLNFDMMTRGGGASPDPPAFPQPQPSAHYRLFRGALRMWLALIFRRIRLLQSQHAPAGGPVLLVVNHPASFFDALLLLATMERPVRCLLQANLIHGLLRRLFAWGLEVLPFEAGDAQVAAVEAATGLLREGCVVMIFGEERLMEEGTRPRMSIAIAERALRDPSRLALGHSLQIVPVHLFLPVAPSQSEELLVQLAAPVPTMGTGGQEQSRLALETALRFASHRNPFRLQPANLEVFMEDLQAILIQELEEEWAARPNWKQKADGFVLSAYITGMVKSLNETHPGRLVGLREAMDSLAEKRRQLALREFKLETAGKWIKSPFRKLAVWAEGITGFPVALYGAINHLIIAAVLAWLGLLRRGLDASTGEWIGRVITVIGCYAAQVALVSRVAGRAGAGYYLLSLIISGVYMLRYAWLYQRRTSILLGRVTIAGQWESLARRRKELVESLNLARERYAESQNLPRASYPT